MIDNIIDRCALLLALIKLYPKGLEISMVETIVPRWREHIKFLNDMGITIKSDASLKLTQPTYFDLYQSVPPEIRDDVEEILWNLIDRDTILEDTKIPQKTFQINDEIISSLSQQILKRHLDDTSGAQWIQNQYVDLPIACIHCYQPRCMTYDLDAFATTDKFSSRVCPADLIDQSADGLVTIDQTRCSGCMLCIIGCPIGAISMRNQVATKTEYTDIPNHEKYVHQSAVTMQEKQIISDSSLSKLIPLSIPFVLTGTMLEILDNFDNKISRLNLNWNQDQYYVWVRNCFRELGFTALYTGSPGKLKRSDVTLTKPFYVGIEVKSPAESNIDVGALRQAVEARLEVSKTYNIDVKDCFCAAIGSDIARGSNARAQDWKELSGVIVPLIRSRYLLYMLLKHKTTLPQNAESDVRRLFTDFSGEIGKDELIKYFDFYFTARRKQILEGNVSVSLPVNILKLIKNDKTEAMRLLENLETDTYEEIENCFVSPDRTARGKYKT